MIKNYFIMKKNEWKVKGMVYGIVAMFIDNQKELLSMLQKIYNALKDVPVEEIQNEFVSKIAEIIYNENNDKTE